MPDKSGKPRFKRHTNKHHVYPTSRFILKKKPFLHTAWHDVFENDTPEEAMEKIRGWMLNPGEFEKKILKNQRKAKAWKMLFGRVDIPLSDVLKIIKSDWTFPGIKMVKEDIR